MKIKTVWGVLPAFIIDRSIDSRLDGVARGPVVTLTPAAETRYNTTLAHELVHVKQNYALFGLLCVVGMLTYFVSPVFAILGILLGAWRLTPTATFLMETAAYGETVRQMVAGGLNPGSSLQAVAHVLDGNTFYKENATYEQILRQITKRYLDKRIF